MYIGHNMNSVIERVNLVCQTVRKNNKHGISFKKLIGSIRTTFKEKDFDLKIITKKDKSLDPSEFYVNAYYDADDDFNNETPIEIFIFHNFSDTNIFSTVQITDLLVQVFDATVHEYRHQIQSQARKYEVYSNHDQSPYSDYLTDPDEVDAYALSIAIELLRSMSKERAIRYMSRITVLAKMRLGTGYLSPNLKAYIDHFGLKDITKVLAKKVYKHINALDKSQIFV